MTFLEFCSDCIIQLEGVNIFNQSDSDLDTESISVSADLEELTGDFEKVDDSSENDITFGQFECENCDFKTEHERGLKVHVTRKHKLACEFCVQIFKEKEHLQRHLKMEEVFRNIEDEKSEEFGLELKIQRVDEICCVVVSEANPRDDNLPVLFLHSSDCWNQSGHSCQDLPEYDFDKNEMRLNNEY